MFGEHIANATCGFKRMFPGKWTHGVRSRYPRVNSRGGGDAIISLDLGSNRDPVSPVFQDDNSGAYVGKIAEVFGDRIANAVEESDLRQWEKQRGHMDRTDCVKMLYRVELRIRDDDASIANILHSQHTSPGIQ